MATSIVTPEGMPAIGKNGAWWIQAIREFGPTTAIALFLVWYLTLGSGNPAVLVKHLEISLADHQQSMAAHISSTSADQRELRLYLRAICINTSKTDNQRAICSVP